MDALRTAKIIEKCNFLQIHYMQGKPSETQHFDFKLPGCWACKVGFHYVLE